jgi:photosystem II stability/assembly factor-like uncharacterized protein
LTDVWGRSPTSVWAVGEGGTILSYNGDRWQPSDASISTRLNAVWGWSAGQREFVFAVGNSGVILRHGG